MIIVALPCLGTTRLLGGIRDGDRVIWKSQANEIWKIHLVSRTSRFIRTAGIMPDARPLGPLRGEEYEHLTVELRESIMTVVGWEVALANVCP